MEPKPKVAQRSPYVADTKAGRYAWCSCGESKNQPFCDGSHKVEGKFRPMVVDLDEDKKVAWCGCKQTKNPPYCDGSHKDCP